MLKIKIIYWRWAANVALLIIGIRRAYDLSIGWLLVIILHICNVLQFSPKGGTLFLLCEYGYLPDSRAGFYCKDPALSFTPGDEMVPNELLCSVIALVPPLVLALNEMLKHWGDQDGYSISKFLRDMDLVYVWMRGYGQSLSGGMFFMQTIKYIAGNPRPTFLTVCAPDKAVNCTAGEYIEDFECTSTIYDAHAIVDNNRSFPSGHTMSSVFMALFLFWYLQRRCGGPWLWAGSLQLAAMGWAALASLSRMSDHRHHWWDVLAGCVVGVLMAAYAVKMLCDDFVCDSQKPSEFFRFLERKFITTENKNKSGEFILRTNIA